MTKWASVALIGSVYVASTIVAGIVVVKVAVWVWEIATVLAVSL